MVHNLVLAVDHRLAAAVDHDVEGVAMSICRVRIRQRWGLELQHQLEAWANVLPQACYESLPHSIRGTSHEPA